MIHTVPFHRKFISDWGDNSFPRFYMDNEMKRWLEEFVGVGYSVPVPFEQNTGSCDWGWDWYYNDGYYPFLYTRNPRSAVLFKLTWSGV